MSECPACGVSAYVGITQVSCPNPDCRHYDCTAPNSPGDPEYTKKVITEMERRRVNAKALETQEGRKVLVESMVTPVKNKLASEGLERRLGPPKLTKENPASPAETEEIQRQLRMVRNDPDMVIETASMDCPGQIYVKGYRDFDYETGKMLRHVWREKKKVGADPKDKEQITSMDLLVAMSELDGEAGRLLREIGLNASTIQEMQHGKRPAWAAQAAIDSIDQEMPRE